MLAFLSRVQGEREFFQKGEWQREGLDFPFSTGGGAWGTFSVCHALTGSVDTRVWRGENSRGGGKKGGQEYI